MTVYLFLSPHLDDAVFSCGGMIHHLATTQNAQVIVFTVMAGDPPTPLPDNPLIRELHGRWQAGQYPAQTRRDEDMAATQLLGATSTHLTIPDCVYRTEGGKALYFYEEDIFGDVHRADPAVEMMNTLTLPYPPSEMIVYAPLGLGHHVDHLLVRDWVLKLISNQKLYAVYFYEDYPYAEDQDATQYGMRAFPHKLKPNPQPLSEENFEYKIKAATCYRSQISTFWQNLEDMRRHFYAYNTYTGTLEEKFWSLDD